METGTEIPLVDSLTPRESREKIPFADKIVVATNFLYRNYHRLAEGEQREIGDTDGIRGDLAIQSLSKAINQGIQVVAADGGSSKEFLSALERFNKGLLILVDTKETPGRGPQRRAAFEVASHLSGKKAIVYFQPEKDSLMDFLAEITQPIIDGSADVVVPARTPDLFEKLYPPYMRESELAVNKTYNYLMHRAGLLPENENLDWFFGPVVFKNDPEIVALFLKKYKVEGSVRSRIEVTPNPEMHSDGHFFPIIEALFNKRPVVSVEIPFVYPQAQRANEMSPEKIALFQKRRKEDGAAYRLEAIHLLALLKGDPRSKIRLG